MVRAVARGRDGKYTQSAYRWEWDVRGEGGSFTPSLGLISGIEDCVIGCDGRWGCLREGFGDRPGKEVVG